MHFATNIAEGKSKSTEQNTLYYLFLQSVFVPGWGSVHGGQRDGTRGSYQPGGPAGPTEGGQRPAGQGLQGGGSLPGAGYTGAQAAAGQLVLEQMNMQLVLQNKNS